MNQGQEECDQKISNVEVKATCAASSFDKHNLNYLWTNVGQMENNSYIMTSTALINCDQIQLKWKRQTLTIYFCIVNKEMHEIWCTNNCMST